MSWIIAAVFVVIGVSLFLAYADKLAQRRLKQAEEAKKDAP